MKSLLIILFIALSSMYANKLNVTVSILPQKYFLEQITKERININVMVKPGFSPATYEPQTSQMKLLSKSKAYFSMGVPFENSWLEKFEKSNKKMLMVDTSKDIVKQEMGEHEHEESHHEKNSVHASLDPHVWLNPLLVKIITKNMYETMILLDAKNKKFYTNNYNAFIKELDVLDKKIEKILSGVNGAAFMVFHPSWGYFASRYNLEQITVEKQGKEPKPRELIALIKESKKHNIKVIFTSSQFSKKAVNTIASNIGANTITIDSLAYEYGNNLISTAKEISNSYK